MSFGLAHGCSAMFPMHAMLFCALLHATVQHCANIRFGFHFEPCRVSPRCVMLQDECHAMPCRAKLRYAMSYAAKLRYLMRCNGIACGAWP